jgi:tetratricopeptide (TPR) repeat protein
MSTMEPQLPVSLRSPFSSLGAAKLLSARPSLSSFTSLRRIATLLLLVALFLVVIKAVAAQPGDQRTPEEIRKQLNERLDQLNDNINNNLRYGRGYTNRGEVYAELSWRSKEPVERNAYAERALEDFNTAVGLDPGDWVSLEKRAAIRQAMDFLGNFDAIVADYKEAIRLARESRRKNPSQFSGSESPVHLYSGALSGVYLNRAEAFLRDPESLKATPWQLKEYSVWDDFDKAISYAQKSVQQPNELWNVIEASVRKGDAAFRSGEYDMALDAYQSDTKYLGENYQLFCDDDQKPDSYCASRKREFTLRFSMKRAKVYVKLREPEKALAELGVYFEKAYHQDCAQPFQLRAKANRLLGRPDLALADEEKARTKFGDSSAGCEQ